MHLYDILACPHCKLGLARHEETLVCERCGRAYPIINTVPVLLPDASIPATQYQHELQVRKGYDPWLHRTVLQSLPASSIVLDMGAGNMGLDLPNVVRMDVTLTPYVDVVGDAHALPFLPEVFDFIFSLAVVEHVRQPFVAAEEMYRALRRGGYVYNECSFVFAYHGYPHHYFNASIQGLEQVFGRFTRLRTGVATYQMPSFALRSVMWTYLRDLGSKGQPDVSRLRRLLGEVLALPLGTYDSRFTEATAPNTAAGVFFFGVKSDGGVTEVIPEAVQRAWQQSPALQRRAPQPLDLSLADNVLLWALHEGRRQDGAIRAWFEGLQPFHKHETVNVADSEAFAALPVVEARFGYIAEPEVEHQDAELAALHGYLGVLETALATKEQHILKLEAHIRGLESGRVMRLLRRFARRRG